LVKTSELLPNVSDSNLVEGSSELLLTKELLDNAEFIFIDSTETTEVPSLKTSEENTLRFDALFSNVMEELNTSTDDFFSTLLQNPEANSTPHKSAASRTSTSVAETLYIPEAHRTPREYAASHTFTSEAETSTIPLPTPEAHGTPQESAASHTPTSVAETSNIPLPTPEAHSTPQESAASHTPTSEAETLNIPLQNSDAQSTPHKPATSHTSTSVAENLNIPSPFKKTLFWPDVPPSTSVNTALKRKIVPTNATSVQWIEYFRKKDEEKAKKLKQVEDRKAERLEKKQKLEIKKKAGAKPGKPKKETNTSIKKKSAKKRVRAGNEEWFCSICNTVEQQDMIKCAKCETWYHETCVVLDDSPQFFCDYC